MATVDFEALCGHSSLAAAGHKELFSWLTHPSLRVSAFDSCGASWTSLFSKILGQKFHLALALLMEMVSARFCLDIRCNVGILYALTYEYILMNLLFI